MPEQPLGATGQAWRQGLEMLEARTIDMAVLPVWEVPLRFVARRHYDARIPSWRCVKVMRLLASRASPLFAGRIHLLVSLSGNAYGFVDAMLAKRGLARRVALTVPSFTMALAHLAGSDLHRVAAPAFGSAARGALRSRCRRAAIEPQARSHTRDHDQGSADGRWRCLADANHG